MSITKEIAHDLRTVTTQPEDLAVLPAWAKVVPIVFYAAFVFCLLGLAYYTFNAKIYETRKEALNRVVRDYQDLLSQDKTTTSRLIEQRNAAVQIARWVDYSPMIQKVLVGIFAPLTSQVQINDLQLERKPGAQPEYTINLSFHASEEDIGFIIKKMRDSLAAYGWSLTTVSQAYQETVTSFQGYIQPIPSMMPFFSQYLPMYPDPNKSPAPAASTPAAATPNATGVPQ
jgi:hypothetical protein